MPNGDDKNWVRVCAAVDGFRGRYGRWPTAVRMPPACFADLVGHILTPVGFALVSSVVAFASEDDLSERTDIIAVGESGAAFRYGEEGDREPDPRTLEYFGPSVVRSGMGGGLEGVTLHDPAGKLIWAGPAVRPTPGQVPTPPIQGSVQLSDFLAQADADHPARSNPVVACNALYKNATSFNCYLTPVEAITLAQHLTQKAQLILDEGLVDAAIQLWNKGAASERLYCGLIKARKGPRKGTKKTPPGMPGGGE